MPRDSPILAAQRRRLAGELSGAATVFALLVALAGATLAGSFTAHWAESTLDQPMDIQGLQRHQATRPMVGALPVQPTGRDCSSDQEALFSALRTALRETFGEPLECPHLDSASGDTIQRTSTGLAIYRVQSRVPSFTDGYHRWAMKGQGLITWEGESLDPPS